MKKQLEFELLKCISEFVLFFVVPVLMFPIAILSQLVAYHIWD